MHDLAALLPDGVARRDELTLASSTSSMARWLQHGDLVLLHPGVVALPVRAQNWPVRARAATLWTRAPLSHRSALTHGGLLPMSPGPVHVTVPTDRWPRGSPGVIAHRTTLPMRVVQHDRLPILGMTRSVVDAWSWAHQPRRNPDAARDIPAMRQVLIDGVRDGPLSVHALRVESAAQAIHAGRGDLTALLELIAGGCQSELEIWGVTHVLNIPGLPTPVQQHEVVLPNGQSVQLDAAFLEARVAIEMDGARFHDGRAARERDMRRDSALAVLGWMVLRYSYQRLTQDVSGCRHEIDDVVRRRRTQR